MKNLLTLLLLLALFSSCTKNVNAGAGSHGSVTCTCNFVYRPGRDTTVSYDMDPASAITVDSQCRYQSKAVKQTFGNGSCSL